MKKSVCIVHERFYGSLVPSLYFIRTNDEKFNIPIQVSRHTCIYQLRYHIHNDAHFHKPTQLKQSNVCIGFTYINSWSAESKLYCRCAFPRHCIQSLVCSSRNCAHSIRFEFANLVKIILENTCISLCHSFVSRLLVASELSIRRFAILNKIN